MAGSTWGRAMAGGAVTFGIGYLIMKVTTPTDKQFYDSLSPELKKQVDYNRTLAERRAAHAEQIERARNRDENEIVWASPSAAGGSGSGRPALKTK